MSPRLLRLLPDMKRRDFIRVIGVAAAAWPLVAQAQQAKLPTLGVLLVGNREPFSKLFWEGLREFGYIDGQNIQVELRSAEGKLERLPELAAELVRLKVNIIVASETPSVLAAKNATNDIPIVMAPSGDPVGTGLIASLARPGGNITGTTLLSSTLAGKWLERLKELLPNVSRVAALLNKDNPAHAVAWKETLGGGKTLRIDVQPFEVQGAAMFDEAFASTIKSRVEALVVLDDAMFGTEPARIVALAAKTRLPAVYAQRAFVDDGGLMSYGPNIVALYRNAASFVEISRDTSSSSA